MIYYAGDGQKICNLPEINYITTNIKKYFTEKGVLYL